MPSIENKPEAPLEATTASTQDWWLLDWAWTIIANASNWLGDVDHSSEWVQAAKRWRNEYHEHLSARPRDWGIKEGEFVTRDELVTAIDALWGWMPAEQVEMIRGDDPGLFDLCCRVHWELWRSTADEELSS